MKSKDGAFKNEGGGNVSGKGIFSKAGQSIILHVVKADASVNDGNSNDRRSSANLYSQMNPLIVIEDFFDFANAPKQVVGINGVIKTPKGDYDVLVPRLTNDKFRENSYIIGVNNQISTNDEVIAFTLVQYLLYGTQRFIVGVDRELSKFMQPDVTDLPFRVVDLLIDQGLTIQASTFYSARLERFLQEGIGIEAVNLGLTLEHIILNC